MSEWRNNIETQLGLLAAIFTGGIGPMNSVMAQRGRDSEEWGNRYERVCSRAVVTELRRTA